MEVCIAGAMEWVTPMPTRWRVFGSCGGGVISVLFCSVRRVAGLGIGVVFALDCCLRCWYYSCERGYLCNLHGMWIVGYILSLQWVDITPNHQSEMCRVTRFSGIRIYFQ
jgi:hypothetical protein